MTYLNEPWTVKPRRIRPFQIAHSHIAVKFSENEISSLLFSSLEKQLEIYFNFFTALKAVKIS